LERESGSGKERALRIVSGEFRGKTLAAPAGDATRPTSDRARQAIFNILEHAPWSEGVREKRVIDLFAGSGALGFEALSRGAAFCLFVETDEAARGAIRENVDAMGLFGRTRVHRRDATQLGVRPGADGPAFDLAFLDPPYGKGLGETALARLAQGGWLAPGATLVFERGATEGPFEVQGYELLDARDYGAARVNFLRHGAG
jgi:16S rRNA (guanine966-N2)-methyltransferase